MLIVCVKLLAKFFCSWDFPLCSFKDKFKPNSFGTLVPWKLFCHFLLRPCSDSSRWISFGMIDSFCWDSETFDWHAATAAAAAVARNARALSTIFDQKSRSLDKLDIFRKKRRYHWDKRILEILIFLQKKALIESFVGHEIHGTRRFANWFVNLWLGSGFNLNGIKWE